MKQNLKKINIYSNLLNDSVNSFDEFIGVKNGLDEFNSSLKDDLSINKLTKRQILELIEKRANAKTKKDFELADKIRKSLDDEGIVLEDNANGTDWRYK